MYRHHPVRPVLAGIPLLAASLLVACSDDVEEVTQVVQDRTMVVASEDDLPKCSDENEGEQAFVKGETSVRICVDKEWIALASDGSVNGDFSCKTVELKDKSGLKIVCNGDSIGVVLNGSDGKNGKDGKDAVLPQDSLEVDSEKIAISLDSLVGVTQKGPFLKGSTVYLYELTDGRTLKQTNGNFTSNISRDDGRYKFTARDLVSQYAMVVVDGYYRNEVTGGTSDAPIRLKAITDMRKRTSVNVNILTQLEFDRVYHLVTRGDKEGNKLTVKQAKRQAQKEILKLFGIELDKDTDAEDMDVFGSSDADAALLAISILLQADRTEADMMALLTEISDEIAIDGKWDSERADTIRAQIADWAFGQNLSKFSENVKAWGLGGELGDFEKYVNNFIATTYGIKECNGVKDSTRQIVDNKLSSYNGRSYQCYEKCEDCDKCEMWVEVRPKNKYMNDTATYGTMIDWRNRRMYYTLIIDDLTCDDKKPIYAYEGLWMAENLDLDYRVKGKSYGNRCYDDDCDTYRSFGHYYSWAAAMDSAGVYSVGGTNCGANTTCGAGNEVRGICPEGWRLPNKDDWNALIYFIAYEYGDSVADLKLRSNTGWGCEFCLDGEDLYGFSMVPSGYCKLGSNCGGQNLYLNLWTSTETNRDNAVALHMTNHDIELDSPNGKELDLRLNEGSSKSTLYPIRCVRISEVFPVANRAKNCKKD